MPSSSARHDRLPTCLLLIIVGVLILPTGVRAQGNGRASTGTGGTHVIQGYVFFPSGKRAEGSIVVKLQSFSFAEISVIPDTSGSFTFGSLAPGSYTVVVNAGDEYEISRETVVIDSDLNLSRMGARVPGTSRRYTVMVHLQPKASVGHAKAAVINASLAEVPEKARKLYEKGLELANSRETLKAVDSLKTAVALYPKFSLALNELGVQYLKLGQAEKAVESLTSAVNVSPGAFTPMLNLGVALLEAKRFHEAETQLREALKRNTSAATAHMYLGLSLAHQGSYDDAEKELLLAIQGSKQLGLAHYYLGGLYWRKHDYPRAVEALETYLRLTPDAADADRVRATIKDLRGRTRD